ncbi:hypothetical protein [Pseudomonas monteilii]|uniref:hypothetical protein n=1 Tax=Pseudomonas monteilii TaxID=76759 RepID=UPI0018A38E48|nr:hypothetical protein [Pseudomonas monteilii]BBV99929.1 hypothetical protein STW0522PSE72_P10390 [Pseudomonas monteilii]BBV99951.1 hypothetical protein STW0522PSE72_P10610 [Pseudomonas monteilii]
MPWLLLCLSALVGLVLAKLSGDLACSWWFVLVPVPVYFGVQVLLGVAYGVYMSCASKRW